MSLTYVVDTPTSSLVSGLSETAAITLARLVCDTTVGADDLTTVNAQNNFVQELVAAVGPKIAFNAIGRQLDKIRATVAEASAGTAYAPLHVDTYKDYLSSYLMRDSFTDIEVTTLQSTSFSAEQIQTLAAFVNAGLPLSTLLQVVDYHILMLFLTKGTENLVGASGINTLCSFQTSTTVVYAPSSIFTKYELTANLATAKYVYAISTLAQNGSPVFDDSISSDHVVAALLVDPVYADDADKVYSLLASLATVCSSTNAIRSSYSNLIKPVNYSLSISGTIALGKNIRNTSSNITLPILSSYTALPSSPKKNMWFYNRVSSAGSIIEGSLTPGTLYDPTQKQLITAISLQGQNAQEIYASLNFTSSNNVDNATNELAAFKLYGKTIQQIRSVVDNQNLGIPSYNKLDKLRAAGFSNTEITNAFSSNMNEFAVLIGVCNIVQGSTGNKLKYEAAAADYEFKYVAADAIKSSIVARLREIVTADETNTVIGINNSTKASYRLHTHIMNCYNDFAGSNAQITKITAANAEPAILRWIHSSAAMVASSTGVSDLGAFTAYNGVDNMYPFMNLKYTLGASPSGLTVTAFLKLPEFATYTEATEFAYAIDTDATKTATYNKVKSVAAAGETRQSFDKYVSTSTNLPNKQFYTLGKFAKHHHLAGSNTQKTFDNGFTFVDAYPYMATSTASKIESIKAQSWPKAIAFTYPSMLLADVSTDIMKKMNTSYPTQVSDDALMLANAIYPTSTIWTSFTELLAGPLTNNSIDNISYKALLRAGGVNVAQYIKVDLAKNINAAAFGSYTEITGANAMTVAQQKGGDFALLGLPFADALFVARKVNTAPFTVKDIVANTKFSRFERRKVFDNVTQAAQQLDKTTFLNLVWQYADLEANIKSTNPLNIQLVDLLSLTYSATEADADGYINTAASNRLAYHDAVVRKNMVKLFYPNLSEADVAIIASLNNVDEILDALASRSLV